MRSAGRGVPAAPAAAGAAVPALVAGWLAFWRETVVRVVQAFDAPRFGIGHPSVATASVPTYQQLFAHYGVLGVGTTVGGDD